MRAKLTRAMLAAALLALPIAATAQVAVGITVAPPAVLYEPVPPPRAGWIWEPGHWVWINGQYVWRRGHWIAARPGYRWMVGAWVPRGPNWVWVPGHWAPP
jgi:WXXGXW repeat (2 copies)